MGGKIIFTSPFWREYYSYITNSVETVKQELETVTPGTALLITGLVSELKRSSAKVIFR